MKPIGDMNTVRAKLLMAGFSSLSAWARAHGHHPKTAWRAVTDWGERTDRPWGGINRQIIGDLRRTFREMDVESA